MVVGEEGSQGINSNIPSAWATLHHVHVFFLYVYAHSRFSHRAADTFVFV